MPINETSPEIKELWKTGLWFEEYIAKFLRAHQWKTWTRVRVLGASGIPHEIDVLGIKNGFVLIVECKTGQAKREDVFNFWAKFLDLKVHIGVFAMLKELDKETKEFLSRSLSSVLLEKLEQKKRREISEDIKKTIIAKK